MHGSAHHLAIKKQREQGSSHPLSSLNTLAYGMGVIGPMVTLPQIYAVWVQKNVVGVSMFSWIAFTLLSSFWCYYATKHKERPLIISQGLWALMNGLVALGVILYR